VFCAKSAESLEKIEDRLFADAKECVRVYENKGRLTSLK
jgi:hypothetical protein